MIDTISGAKASAVIYSLVETAKANNLNGYGYMKHLLTVIPNHMDDHNTDFCEALLPWLDSLPEECKKKIKKQPPKTATYSLVGTRYRAFTR